MVSIDGGFNIKMIYKVYIYVFKFKRYYFFLILGKKVLIIFYIEIEKIDIYVMW